MSDPRIEDILDTLGTLLRKYGHDYHAAYVSDLRSIWPEQRSTFQLRASSGDMWGGSGSVFDVQFCDANRPPEEVKSDNRAFCIALASLAHAMRREGVGSKNADDIARVVASWYPDAGLDGPAKDESV